MPDFMNDVLYQLDHIQVDTGCKHPATDTLEKALRAGGDEAKAQLMVVFADSRPRYTERLLYAMAYLPKELIDWEFYTMARSALRLSTSIVIRDGAIGALERWGGQDAIDILKEHKEPEPWLAKYVAGVIRDLEQQLAMSLEAAQ